MSDASGVEVGATRVAIVGLGAIGGSVALALLRRGSVPVGFATDDDDRRRAAQAGVKVADSLAAAVSDVDLVLLAVPLDHLADVAREVVARCPAHATVLHAASLLRPDATQFEPPVAARVFGTHPLAGTAQGGFAAAREDLFRGATVYVEDRARPQVREDAELFWSMAGANRIRYVGAAEHDDLMAAVSHVPQVVSTAVAATLAYADVPRHLLGPGGKDATRLAASSWSMWRPLLLATPGRTLAMLESIETELREFREAIMAQTLDETGVTWSVARNWALEDRPKP